MLRGPSPGFRRLPGTRAEASEITACSQSAISRCHVVTASLSQHSKTCPFSVSILHASLPTVLFDSCPAHLSDLASVSYHDGLARSGLQDEANGVIPVTNGGRMR